MAVILVLTLGACGSGSSTTAVRPDTPARLEIVQPRPNESVGPDFAVDLNLIGAKVVPENVTGGTLRPDEGHIHLLLDGRLVTMTFGTTQQMKDVPPGPHTLQAEFVAADHAPFRNRVVAAVAFMVTGQGAP